MNNLADSWKIRNSKYKAIAHPRGIFSFINPAQFGHIRTFALMRYVTFREYERDICTRERVVRMSPSATWRRLRAGGDIDTTTETGDI